MYATENNFTGVRIYDFTDAYLRYGTVKKLANVQKELKEQGYSLKIWDAYRPFEAQQKLWEVYPDPNYVANPANGMKSIILEEQWILQWLLLMEVLYQCRQNLTIFFESR